MAARAIMVGGENVGTSTQTSIDLGTRCDVVLNVKNIPKNYPRLTIKKDDKWNQTYIVLKQP